MPVTPPSDLPRFIRERRTEIVERWVRGVLALPQARGLSRPALLDHINDVLEALANNLEQPPDLARLEPDLVQAVDTHVLDRLEVGAGLALVTAELALVRRTIEGLWLEGAQAAAPLEPLRALDGAVEALMVRSAERLGHLRGRLFDTLERITVAAETRRLPEFLGELLRIAQDDIPGVDTAAVLVREGDALRVRAAVGVEQNAEEPAPLRVGEGFAGLVAAERRPVLVSDASTDPLVRRPALQRSEIRALYGVPLIAPGVAGGAVIGVAHMGSRRSHDFSDEAKTLFRIVAGRAAVLVHEALLRERLEEQQARFQAIADASPAIVFLKDAEGRYQFMSRRAIEQVGYSPEAFLGRTDADVWPADVAGRLVATDRAVAATRNTVTTEEVVVTRDGRNRTYVTGKFPVLDANGRVVGIGGIATDITERKRREQAQALLARAGALLAESLELEGTLTTFADLVVPSLADCCVVDLVEDDGAVRRLRVVHADPDRADLARTLHDLPLDRARPHLAHAVLNARRPVFMPDVPPGYLDTISQSPEHRRALEELAPRSMIQVPFTARGRLLGALVLVATSADRRYGRDDLTLAEDLARLASLTIDNARLFAAAQQALRARDEVLAIVAHDLRNPLNVVVSGITAVLGAPPDADVEGQRHRLGLALRAARRAGRLTHDLLDVARLEAGRFSVQPAPRDARALLGDAAEAQRPLAAEAGLELRVDAPPGLPRVLADNDRAAQVLENLLSNAVRFTPRGGRVVLAAAAEGRQVRFAVEDTGPGIPAEERARVFERFWQGRRASRRGAGLGLLIARGIVEAHGGRIWIEAPPGGGTRVCFTLPVAEV